MHKAILIAQVQNILNSFEVILEKAKRNQTCLRKAVGCQLMRFENEETKFSRVLTNGPSVHGNPCTNIVGNCGCSHAEPRAILDALWPSIRIKNYWMVCTYSPCTNCANIIIDSRVIKGVFRDILTEHDKRGEEFLKAADIKVITKLHLQGLSQFLQIGDAGQPREIDLGISFNELIAIIENAQTKR